MRGVGDSYACLVFEQETYCMLDTFPNLFSPSTASWLDHLWSLVHTLRIRVRGPTFPPRQLVCETLLSFCKWFFIATVHSRHWRATGYTGIHTWSTTGTSNTVANCRCSVESEPRPNWCILSSAGSSAVTIIIVGHRRVKMCKAQRRC